VSRCAPERQRIVGFRPIDIGEATKSVAMATIQSVVAYTSIGSAQGNCSLGDTRPIIDNFQQEIQALGVGDLDADGIDDVVISLHDRSLILRQGTTTKFEKTAPAETPPEP